MVTAVALAVHGILSKCALFALNALDAETFTRPHAVELLAVVKEDLWLVLAFAAFVALTLWLTPARLRDTFVGKAARASRSALYIVLTLWASINVPVARQLASPLTYSFLHATGGALGDSISRYVTLTNLGVPIALCALALGLPRWIARWNERWLPTRHNARKLGLGLAVVVALALIAPTVEVRTDLQGSERNAVVTLLRTTWQHAFPGAGGERPSLLTPACQATDTSSAAPPPGAAPLQGLARGKNIVWVVLESARARSLNLYGEPRDATPHLTSLASAGSIVFENAYAAYPESIKGLYSFLCGREPPLHREASELTSDRFPCDDIATSLARAGYRTGLFHSGWFAYLGMKGVLANRGFETLVDAETITSPYRSSFGVDDRSTALRLLSWIDSRPTNKPFFAMFMPIAGHHPYHAPGPVARPFDEKTSHDEYLNDLHIADDSFGLLRQGMQARGLDDKTVYVVFGDHGEAFREHAGNIAHALFLYEENLHVPFFVAAPGLIRDLTRLTKPLSLIDVPATTLALAGLPPIPSTDGHAASADNDRAIRFFTEQGGRRAGLRDGRWKVIFDEDGARAQLFDVQIDPHERNNIARDHGRIVQRARRCLLAPE